MDLQPEINVRMRSILIDWLTEVHSKFELMPETLYFIINIVDRYLSRTFVSRRELQLVDIATMLIACKYEEIWAPQVVFSLVCNHNVENLFMLWNVQVNDLSACQTMLIQESRYLSWRTQFWGRVVLNSSYAICCSRSIYQSFCFTR